MMPTIKAKRHCAGGALLVAMLVVALVATLAASALSQSRSFIEAETAQRQWTQRMLIFSGAASLAKGLAQAVFEERSKSEAALHSYLYSVDEFGRIEESSEGGGGDRIKLKITIQDMNACINLRNLSTPKKENGLDVIGAVAVDGLSLLYVEEAVNSTYVDALHEISKAGSMNIHQLAQDLNEAANHGENGSMLYMKQADFFKKMKIRGDLAASSDVCYLSTPTKININKASERVLASLLNSEIAQEIIQLRSNGRIQSVSDVVGLKEFLEAFSNQDFVAFDSSTYRATIGLMGRDFFIEDQVVLQFGRN